MTVTMGIRSALFILFAFTVPPLVTSTSVPVVQSPTININAERIAAALTGTDLAGPFQVHEVQRGTAGNNREDGSDLEDIAVSLIHRARDNVGINVDSIEHLGQGLYEVRYTPTVSGHYDLAITIKGGPIASDLSSGVVIRPTRPSAIHSRHNAKPLATEGVNEEFLIQAVDRFGNELLSSSVSSEDQFVVDILGTPHKCSGRLTDSGGPFRAALEYYSGTPSSVIDGDDMGDDMNTGQYRASYLPSLAGTHQVFIKLRSSGGLLATYYRNTDFTRPVLGNTDHLHSQRPQVPWCLSDVVECDSTRLDTFLMFDWGFGSPLNSDQEYPIDSFSVRWVGELTVPSTDEYKISVTLNGNARLVVGGTTVIDTISTPSPSRTLSGTIELKHDMYYPIIVEYIHHNDEALFHLQWSSWSMKEEDQPIPPSSFYYTRHLGNAPEPNEDGVDTDAAGSRSSGNDGGPASPFSVEIVPGVIDITSSPSNIDAEGDTNIEGDGLNRCIATTECSFVIHTKDSAGNHRYNDGTDPGFEINMIGVEGWAGKGRVNDDLSYSSGALSVSSLSTTSQDWQFLDSVEVMYGAKALTTTRSLLAELDRGDTIALAGQMYTVASDGIFDASTIPLGSAILGPSMPSVALYKASSTCQTGSHLVRYTPIVRGQYQLNVKLPPKREVQRLSTNIVPDVSLSGSFTLTFRSPDGIAQTTTNIPYDADANDILLALEDLSNISEIDVVAHSCVVDSNSTRGCSWDIAFSEIISDDVTAAGVDVDLLIPNWDNLVGEGATVDVQEVSAGAPAQSINGFPRTISVVPDDLNPTWTTAHGQGLVMATAGMDAEFTIQAKDGAGNDRFNSVENPDDLFAVTIVPEKNDAVTGSDDGGDGTIMGTVTPEMDGKYKVRYKPKHSGYHTISVVVKGLSDNEAEHIKKSPFRAFVSPAEMSAYHGVASDLPGVTHQEGLSTGVYQSDTHFSIELRDLYGNRVLDGPESEVQIIEMWSSSSPIGGTFNIGYNNASVPLSAGAGIAKVEKAIESLPGLGDVVVATNAAKDSVIDGKTVATTKNLNTIIPSQRLDDVFQVGDWIRIGGNVVDDGGDLGDSFVFSIVAMSTAAPFTITLSSAYQGESNSGAAIFGQSINGPPYGFQYIVSFEPTLGDIDALAVDGSNLTGDDASIEIIACNRNVYQTIESKIDNVLEGNGSDNDGGAIISGTFYITYKGQRTRDLSASIGSDQLKAAMEESFSSSIRQVTVLNEQDIDTYGSKRWELRLDSFEGEIPDLLYAEGHLLSFSGQSTSSPSIIVTATCPIASPANPLLEGQSRAGRPGQDFVVELSGPEEVEGYASYVADGNYIASYISPRVGEYELNIITALSGGLKGQYFNNRWLFGSSINERIDDRIDFVWSASDPVTSGGNDFVSIRWTGYVKPAYNEIYHFRVRVNDGARLWVGQDLLIDKFDTIVDEKDGRVFDEHQGSTALPLKAGRLTPLKIEYHESRGAASLRLEWSSESQPWTVIDSHRLYYQGNSVDASPYTVHTRPIVPTEPRNCTLGVTGADSMTVQWMDPLDDGGETLVTFEIVITDIEASTVQSEKVMLVEDLTFDEDAMSYSFDIVEGLVAGRLYGVQISAGNSEGLGELCAQVLATPMSEPMIVRSVVLERDLGSAMALTVRFEPVKAERSNGSEVTAYIVEWSTDDSFASDAVARTVEELSAFSLIVGGGNERLEYTIEELNPGQEYHVRIIAQNSVGVGLPSLPAAVLAPGSRPDPVEQNSFVIETISAEDDTNVTVYESSTSLFSSWPSVSNDNGFPVVEYVLEYSFVGSTAAPNKIEIDAIEQEQERTHLNYTLTGLTPGQPIRAKISARNALGYSPATMSVPDEIAPLKQKPSRPVDVHLSLDSGRSLKVSFGEPHSDGGDLVTMYRIEWSTDETFDGAAHYNKMADGCGTEDFMCGHVIVGLTEGIDYHVRVYAINSYGFSIPTLSWPRSLAPIQPPQPPKIVKLHGDEKFMDVSFPTTPDVDEYKIEWNAIDDLYQSHTVQRIVVGGGEAFKLGFLGHRTATLTADSSGYEVKKALAALPPIGGVSVIREDGTGDNSWLATFPNYRNMEALRIHSMTTPDSDADANIVVRAYDGFEEQRIICRGCSQNIVDTFRLSFAGNATQQLSTKASPAEVKLALEDIGTGTVMVSRSTNNELKGFVWIITFLERLGTGLPMLQPVYNRHPSRSDAHHFEMYATEESKGRLPRMEGGAYDHVVVNSTNDDGGGWLKYRVDLPRRYAKSYFAQVSGKNQGGWGQPRYSTPPLHVFKRIGHSTTIT